jgi:nanoRNase/pAp phosphatase (c-di-AMP/oligoRNAs hydrolase)
MDGKGSGFSVTPPDELTATLRDPQGTVLCLGHVHPDGDVLGTLFGLGLALSAAGASVTFAGPHPVPGVLAFRLSTAERGRRRPRRTSVIVMTDSQSGPSEEAPRARKPRRVSTSITTRQPALRHRQLDRSSAAATGEMISTS